jgi:hypothetical protein
MDGIDNSSLFTFYYFFALIMSLIALISLLVCIYQILQGYTSRINVSFSIYFVAVLLQALIIFWGIYFPFPKGLEAADSISANFFTVLEFLIFNLVFYRFIYSAILRNVIVLASIFFPVGCIYYWITNNTISSFPYHLSVVEAFYFVGICLTYFYELFQTAPTKELTKEPSFWIATGVLVYFVCMIPNFLMLEYVYQKDWYNYESLAWMNFIASGVLYLFIVKALLCKNKQATLLSL